MRTVFIFTVPMSAITDPVADSFSPSPPEQSQWATFWHLVGAGEPYRLLFPIGTFLGLIGVMLWPAFVWGGLPYPLEAHAGIMIQGFLASFVFGFLGTALPRLLDAPRLGLKESLFLTSGTIGVSATHLAGAHLFADAIFLAVFGSFLVLLGLRLPHRKDLPPPGFVLVLLGMLCALIGTAVQIADHLAPAMLSETSHLLGKRLLQQGFLLLPIMGIGAFLLPRFFGLPNRQNFPESLKPPPGWWRKAAFAAACGATVLLSFVAEAFHLLPLAYTLRGLAVLAYFAREVPVHKAAFSKGSLALALRIALACLPLGFFIMAAMPGRQVTFVHVVFIGGFSLLTFTVASRVILGHSGQDRLFSANLRSVFALIGFLILALATRLAADWMPDSRFTHYAYAALAWTTGVAIWAAAFLPGVRKEDRS